MENSYNSSLNKAVSSGGPKTDEEESGWTAYFEDFLSNPTVEQPHSCCSDDDHALRSCNNFVSDAASYSPWKTSATHQGVACYSACGGGSMNLPRKLNFRKTRARDIPYDESLEDTASSPVNSPKVGRLMQRDINHKKTEDNYEISLGKGSGSDAYQEQHEDKRDEMDFDDKNRNGCIDLKKRGLCLVPLSMFTKFLG